MDGRDENKALSIDFDTEGSAERIGLQTLLGRISPASFHNSHERLKEADSEIVRRWVHKWTPRLRTSSNTDLLSMSATMAHNPEQTIVDVFSWLSDLSSPHPIMWIHDEDRSQTSFFSQTIAGILDRLGKPTASFFSSTSDDGDITSIIPTLAFQLAQNVPSTRPPIAQAVLRDGSIFNLQAEPQITKLILDPLLFALRSTEMETTGIPNVFLIHGLEDFNDTNRSQSSLLYAFSDALALLATNNVPYRLLLVSRHSSHIERCISNTDIRQRVLRRPITICVSFQEEDEIACARGPWRLMNTLKGHTSVVTGVAFSPDGTRLASSSVDNTVRLWQGRTGSFVATLEGHTDQVFGVAFSPDGSRLATGSSDKTARLWNVKMGSLVATLAGHFGSVHNFRFSPDGLTIACATFNKKVWLWDVKTGSLRTTLEHSSVVNSIAFSPDGSRLASGSGDNTVHLWDSKTGGHVAILMGHSSAVFDVAFSPDGSRLASGSNDKTARLWDVKTGNLVATLEGHSDAVDTIVFSAKGSTLACMTEGKTVRLWNAKIGSLRTTLEHPSEVTCVAFSPDASIFASGSSDNTVRLWDVRTGKPVAILEGHTQRIHDVAFSPDGSRLASASADGTIRMWHQT